MADRRDFLRFAAVLPLGATLGGLCGCEGGPAAGPVEIKWDRDTCTRCSMVISDRRFAAQVRGGPEHAAHKFDDIGCAMFWLRDKPWAEEAATELWVAGSADAKWIAAKPAFYRPGRPSPMGYNYAAQAQQEPDTLPYAEMRQRVLALGK